MAVEPFELLVDIEQKCKFYARPIPWQKVSGKIWYGIGYQCSGIDFVSPLSEVLEVIPYPSLTTFPSSSEWFIGMTNLRGHLLPIIDLQGFVMGTVQNISPLSRIIVVDFENTGVGFLVTQVSGVQRFIESKQKKTEEDLKGYSKFVKEHFVQGERKWQIFSLKSITLFPEFYHVLKEMGSES